jgi:putative hydrolase of the HAD superfamily
MSVRLIFDLDDTLYPERDYAIGGFRAVSRHFTTAYGAPDTTDEMVSLLDQGHLGGLFKIVLARVNPQFTDDALKRALKAYAAHEPALTLFPDAAATLHHFASAGAPMGLITDGHAATQKSKVAALGIAPHFSHIVYTGALGPDRAFHKPHPAAFELMHAALGGDADRFIYIGDNPAKDFIAPRAMGWITIMVDRPSERARRIHKPDPPPPDAAPHHTVLSLCEIPALLPR